MTISARGMQRAVPLTYLRAAWYRILIELAGRSDVLGAFVCAVAVLLLAAVLIVAWLVAVALTLALVI